MRYFLELSYHGGNYHGWQKQPNAMSVQEVLEKALTTILRVPTPITGAGRTDAGVHAEQMYAHFDADAFESTDDFTHQLNRLLPWDIAIQKIHPVTADAHARYDALERTYVYEIMQRKDVFSHGLRYFYKPALSISSMNDAAEILMDYEDFECFSKVNTDVKTFLCEIAHAKWEETSFGYCFTISANRFLRNMVRAIVGTLIEVGQGKRSVHDVRKLIESKDRSQAGFSAPAHGLYLADIEYPKTIFHNG